MTLSPEHSVKANYLTLYFGFRQSEVFTLQRYQVDFEAGAVRLYAEDVKDSEDAFMPGAPDSMALLVGEATQRCSNYLITTQRNGRWQPIRSPKRAWGSAMRVIKKEFGRKWRWHDIRAAFITHVPLTSGPELARILARHSDYKTTLGYVAVADETRARKPRAGRLFVQHLLW